MPRDLALFARISHWIRPLDPNKGESIRQVKIVPAENVRPVQEILAASGGL